jgi:hypothetical protein
LQAVKPRRASLLLAAILALVGLSAGPFVVVTNPRPTWDVVRVQRARKTERRQIRPGIQSPASVQQTLAAAPGISAVFDFVLFQRPPPLV